MYVFDDEGKLTDDFCARNALYRHRESGTKTAQTIKSHHNVGTSRGHACDSNSSNRSTRLQRRSARALGTALGMPDSIVWRQPFPGPGLHPFGGSKPKRNLKSSANRRHLTKKSPKTALNQSDVAAHSTSSRYPQRWGNGDGRTYDHDWNCAVTSIDARRE